MLQESTTFVAGIIEDVECEAEDEEQDLFRADHMKVVALLDHYDLFGGSLGVSSTMRSHEIDLADHNLEDFNLEETIENWAFAGDSAESMRSSKIEVGHNVPTSIRDELFEHYGLFGASAGAWSG